MTNVSGTIATVILGAGGIGGIITMPIDYWNLPYIYGVVVVSLPLIISVYLYADDIEIAIKRRWRNFMHKAKRNRHESGLGSYRG